MDMLKTAQRLVELANELVTAGEGESDLVRWRNQDSEFPAGAADLITELKTHCKLLRMRRENSDVIFEPAGKEFAKLKSLWGVHLDTFERSFGVAYPDLGPEAVVNPSVRKLKRLLNHGNLFDNWPQIEELVVSLNKARLSHAKK